ncbi:MAG TPA: tetratricopeptide repeat protein, partial [Saprospiraceae bacterium]|nr:tetratricopeptide repeat protein [Saprospiraceae bacterium]
MQKIIFLVLFLAFGGQMLAQNPNLAQHYYRNGEYEKAAAIFKQLLEQSKGNDYYLDKYIDCLMAADDFAEAKKTVKKALKKSKAPSGLLVTYGKILERQGDVEEAKKYYEKAIIELPANRYNIHKLANSFISLTKYDLGIRALEHGAKLLKDKTIFASNLGDLYRRKGDYDKMIESYLISVAKEPGRLHSVESIFLRFLPQGQFGELKEQLYDMLQDDDAPVQIQEMLAWVFIQERDFDNAFRQVKAIDARLKEDGRRVFEMARLAQGEKDYEAAIRGYEYIVDVKGERSNFYFEAKQRALECKTISLTEGYRYTQGQIDSLLMEYSTFLDAAGRNRFSAQMMIEMANIQAFYKKDSKTAMKILEEVIHIPGAKRKVVAEAKLKLGDMYLINGDVWESTLLYSQVDKEFKEDLLGQKARFKNAQLSYFKGDFEWAQTQFGVLKNATSRPIANDAIDMSVFIMDNLGLDTTPEPMRLYSQAEFMVFQNKFDAAFAKLDTLLDKYPEHSLDDDVLYLKGNIEYKLQHFKKAAVYYAAVVDQYPEDIRAD